jgi:hypothetical protein
LVCVRVCLECECGVGEGGGACVCAGDQRRVHAASVGVRGTWQGAAEGFMRRCIRAWKVNERGGAGRSADHETQADTLAAVILPAPAASAGVLVGFDVARPMCVCVCVCVCVRACVCMCVRVRRRMRGRGRVRVRLH